MLRVLGSALRSPRILIGSNAGRVQTMRTKPGHGVLSDSETLVKDAHEDEETSSRSSSSSDSLEEKLQRSCVKDLHTRESALRLSRLNARTLASTLARRPHARTHVR